MKGCETRKGSEPFHCRPIHINESNFIEYLLSCYTFIGIKAILDIFTSNKTSLKNNFFLLTMLKVTWSSSMTTYLNVLFATYTIVSSFIFNSHRMLCIHTHIVYIDVAILRESRHELSALQYSVDKI